MVPTKSYFILILRGPLGQEQGCTSIEILLQWGNDGIIIKGIYDYISKINNKKSDLLFLAGLTVTCSLPAHQKIIKT